MKPGATTRPPASISRAPRSRTSPTACTRPSAMATSARRPGAPVPSTTSPPRMTRSIIGCARPGSVLAEPERFEIPTVRLEGVAVLLMPRRVLGTGEQEPLAVAVGIPAVVVEQAEGDLLVVRVVAVLDGGERERAHQPAAVVAAVEIGARPRHALRRLHRHLGGVELGEDLLRRHGRGALRRTRVRLAVAGG